MFVMEKQNLLSKLPNIIEISLKNSKDYNDFLRIYEVLVGSAVREDKCEHLLSDFTTTSMIDAFALSADPYEINLVGLSKIMPLFPLSREFVYKETIKVIKDIQNLHNVNFKKMIIEDLLEIDPLTYSNFEMLDVLDEDFKVKIGNQILKKYGENVRIEKYILRSIKNRLEKLEEAGIVKIEKDEYLGKMDKLFLLLVRFGGESVDSPFMKKVYEAFYDEKIKLSTVSTYLGRLSDRKVLERSGSRNKREYIVPILKILSNEF